MNEKQITTLSKNIDVFEAKTGDAWTIVDYVDVQTIAGIITRVCLLKNEQTQQVKLQTDKHLLVATDKHVSETINAYSVATYLPEKAVEEQHKIYGDGNLIRYLWGEITLLSNLQYKINNVVFHIIKKTEVEI